MENPSTWGKAENVVHDAYMQWHGAHEKGVIGLSMTRTITDALRAGDLLSDVPLGYLEHDSTHDPEFIDGCKWCDWEREHNERAGAWLEEQ